MRFNRSFFVLMTLLWLPLYSFAHLESFEKDTIAVFKKVSPYVVTVQRVQSHNPSYTQKDSLAIGAGTGFLWGKDYVVTNYHVVSGAEKIAVIFPGAKRVYAKIVAAAKRKDIVLLRLDNTKKLQSILPKGELPLGNSDSVQVGQVAIAIGDPFGLSKTLTEGVVSAVSRQVPFQSGFSIANMIQTDASINPGNSGGPLLDSQGRLIGMTTLIYSRSGASSGIGFAIPVNTIVSIVRQFLKTGKIIQPGIGVVPISDALTAQIGFPGIIVARVLIKTPASQAGLKGMGRGAFGGLILGDVIIGVNGKRVKTYGALLKKMEKIGIGHSMILHVIRDKKQLKIKIKISNIS